MYVLITNILIFPNKFNLCPQKAVLFPYRLKVSKYFLRAYKTLDFDKSKQIILLKCRPDKKYEMCPRRSLVDDDIKEHKQWV